MPGAPQLVLDHLPDAGALLHHDQRLAAQLVERDRPARERGGPAGRRGRPRRGRTARSATPRCRAGGADDAELELAVARRARRRVCVSETDERDVDVRDAARWNSQRSSGTTTVPPGPVDAPIASVPRERAVGLAGDLLDELLLEREQPLRAAVEAQPASVGSTRRPERSSSCCRAAARATRTCRLTAGCVTPSRSAACEKLRRSTTAQKAAS